MATHDYVIANQSGANTRSDLNNVFQAIVSQNSSGSEPSTTYAYMLWADTGNDLLKVRNAADNAWINLYTLSTGAVSAVADDSITYAKIQNVVNDERILGRVSGADGVIEELTKAQVLTFANVEDGADATDATNVSAAGALMKTGGTMTGDLVLDEITETEATSSGTTYTVDLANGTIFDLTSGSTCTVTMPSAEAGKSFTIIAAVPAAWSGTIKWSGGAAPTTGSGITIFSFVSDGTNWYGMQAGTGFA